MCMQVMGVCSVAFSFLPCNFYGKGSSQRRCVLDFILFVSFCNFRFQTMVQLIIFGFSSLFLTVHHRARAFGSVFRLCRARAKSLPTAQGFVGHLEGQWWSLLRDPSFIQERGAGSCDSFESFGWGGGCILCHLSELVATFHLVRTWKP